MKFYQKNAASSCLIYNKSFLIKVSTYKKMWITVIQCSSSISKPLSPVVTLICLSNETSERPEEVSLPPCPPGFGTSTSSGGLFGSTNTTSNPFGGTTSLFGGSGFSAAQQPGTTVKFNVSTRFQTVSMHPKIFWFLSVFVETIPPQFSAQN